MRCLIVSKYEETRKHICGCLGREAVAAGTVQLCLDVLQKDTGYDAIIVDEQVDVASGEALVGVIRQMKGCHSIPVVLLLDQCDVKDLEKRMMCGASGYLEIPFACEELYKLLQKLSRDGEGSMLEGGGVVMDVP